MELIKIQDVNNKRKRKRKRRRRKKRSSETLPKSTCDNQLSEKSHNISPSCIISKAQNCLGMGSDNPQNLGTNIKSKKFTNRYNDEAGKENRSNGSAHMKVVQNLKNVSKCSTVDAATLGCLDTLANASEVTLVQETDHQSRTRKKHSRKKRKRRKLETMVSSSSNGTDSDDVLVRDRESCDWFRSNRKNRRISSSDSSESDTEEDSPAKISVNSRKTPKKSCRRKELESFFDREASEDNNSESSISEDENDIIAGQCSQISAPRTFSNPEPSIFDLYPDLSSEDETSEEEEFIDEDGFIDDDEEPQKPYKSLKNLWKIVDEEEKLARRKRITYDYSSSD